MAKGLRLGEAWPTRCRE